MRGGNAMQWSVEIRDVETSDFPDLDGVLGLIGEPLPSYIGGEIVRSLQLLLLFSIHPL